MSSTKHELVPDDDICYESRNMFFSEIYQKYPKDLENISGFNVKDYMDVFNGTLTSINWRYTGEVCLWKTWLANVTRKDFNNIINETRSKIKEYGYSEYPEFSIIGESPFMDLYAYKKDNKLIFFRSYMMMSDRCEKLEYIDKIDCEKKAGSSDYKISIGAGNIK